ncbi:hypothetical protein GE191_05535 [Serratia fonticola]|uniref:hypothetical protein n=1 Tax=Serratia fonticola TaxID=47917 RepID=UPI001378F161|nr:hypothetical protein [Serratia fonticola]NBJ33136.1 hypothetical protein [Serratia fonticola]
MKKLLVLATLSVVSLSAGAVVQDQEWGDWYGNTGGMEFAINTDNKAGERLTLECRESRLTVKYSDGKGYDIDSTAKDPVMIIGGKSYKVDNEPSLDKKEGIPAEVLFNALKQADPKETIRFSTFQSGETEPFSANGLKAALNDLTYQDCVDF